MAALKAAGAEFATTAKSAEGPPDRQPSAPPVAAGRASNPVRKETLVHGSPFAPTPTPGPYVAPVGQSTPPPQQRPSGGVARQTAFDATVAVPHPPPPIVGGWRTPVIRPKADPPVGPLEPSMPKKRGAPWLVLVAVLLTVTLVVVAIVANELGH